jgi:hypothetical protein
MSQMSLARVERQGDSPPSFLSSPRMSPSRTRAQATLATNDATRVAALSDRVERAAHRSCRPHRTKNLAPS